MARSFAPESGGGGGYGAIVRSVTSTPSAELDVSLRYYGQRYANPYARPISAPDELEGLRARDETGLRIRATSQVGSRAVLRTIADGWRRISSGMLSGLLYARTDLQLHPSVAWALWAEYRNSVGQRLVLATKLTLEPVRRLSVSTQLQHRWLGWRFGGPRAQQDLAAILNLTSRPVDLLRLRLRLRYDFEDIADNHRLAQALWSYVEVGLTVRERDLLRLRYDFRLFLDRRESTLTREPNPEHWLWLEYVVYF